ncbi:MAG: hypothetical protein GF331_13560 [Chitinivibrionales bacterium]|nr:hypothetical protein [Chitinivibrionales bacterium]
MASDSAAVDSARTQTALFDTLLADGFDFPVGDPDGNGGYLSRTDGRRYDGWAGDWPDDTRALTWGCISMRNEDLLRFYGQVSIGTKILILP